MENSTSTPAPALHVIDDDPSMRASLVSLIESYGWDVQAHASARAFLQAARRDGPACLVLDIQMPGGDGFGLQSELKRLGEDYTVIFLTGHGTIPLSVRAMREGAVEFLTKPFTERELIGAIELAMATETARWEQNRAAVSVRARYDCLTQREKEVFAHVAAGRLNKVIAWDLGIAEVTVKLHRSRIMEKLETATLADLVRAAAQLGIAAP
jgi:FixJ family two-component response regulator